MSFKDTKEGSTHYFNDGCGEPAHNGMKDNLKNILKSVPWLKKPEELEFTAYIYYQALLEIKKLVQDENAKEIPDYTG